MLDLVTREYHPLAGWTRRHMMRVGFLGLGGLSLADLLRLHAQAGADKPKKERAVILLWIASGSSHLETYDLKPDAPDEVRGPFRPCKTRVPGLEVCELLPEHARLADKITLLRS